MRIRMSHPLILLALFASCEKAKSNSADTSSSAPDSHLKAAAPAPGPVICNSGSRPYSIYKWPFFGDLHLHTGHSLDAYAFGTRALPSDAYLFAKQRETITLATGSSQTPPGPSVTIDRPLDFLAVTDHSEWMGTLQGCLDPTSGYYNLPDCERVRSSAPADETWTFQHLGALRREMCAPGSSHEAECAAETRSVWQDEQTAAANAYEPCVFTSLVAYEWTNPTGHRNVIFGTDVVPSAPIDSLAATTSKALWDALDQRCTGGCAAITPPHNTNMSGGGQFALPQSPADVPQMRRYQPLVEIYQHKGSSECYYPGAGASDPWCRFEYRNPGDPNDTPQAYVRTALENGLGYALENSTDNPLQMGIIGATDDHNATPGHVMESDYTGHSGRNDDGPVRRLRSANGSQNGSGALTVAWAEQNTRDTIFAALQRKETYATSGPRIILRFYETSNGAACTPDFPQTIIDQNNAIPMGGTFDSTNLINGAPHFAIAAWPDPFPQVLADAQDTRAVATLRHVQVIKAHGALDASGQANIIEDPLVELSIDPNGGCIDWTDPNFDPSEISFYYVRVLQVPTWRWSHFDCERFPAETGCQQGGRLNRAEAERAWSSPIWYQP